MIKLPPILTDEQITEIAYEFPLYLPSRQSQTRQFLIAQRDDTFRETRKQIANDLDRIGSEKVLREYTRRLREIDGNKL